ncbi:MAG: radical SAM protein [Nanoarchaeota archaeon]|nr:radical SAM protein [Nanoarchaeota archaeon]
MIIISSKNTDSQKFVFIIANTAWYGKRYWQSSPTTLAILTAILKRDGYDVGLIDANLENLTENQVKARIVEYNPHYVLVSGMTLEYKECVHKIFELAKQVNPDIITILGGIYPTLSINVAVLDQNIDFIIRSEGEERLPELLLEIRGKKEFDKVDGLAYQKPGEKTFTINPTIKRIKNLDQFPLPDYSNFDMDKYINIRQKYTQNFYFKRLPVGQIMTSRGCYYHCTFCSSARIYGNDVVFRSPEHTLAEIDMLVKNYGIKELNFVDDNILIDRKKFLAILDGLIERKYDLQWKNNNMAVWLMDDEILEKMKASGCYQITLSIESGSPHTLRLMKKPVILEKTYPIFKKIKELGMELICRFIIGYPGETWDDIRQTFRYAEDIDVDYVLFSIATPFERTELYEVAKRENFLPADFNFEDPKYYGFGKGLITTKEFTPSELEILRAFEWDRINFKTEAKKKKIVEVCGITLEELEIWRKETRRKCGVDVEAANPLSEQNMQEEKDVSS